MFQYYLGFLCGMSYWNTFFKTNFTGVSLGAEKKRPPKVFRRRARPSIQFCQRGGVCWLASRLAGWTPPLGGQVRHFLKQTSALDVLCNTKDLGKGSDRTERGGSWKSDADAHRDPIFCPDVLPLGPSLAVGAHNGIWYPRRTKQNEKKK